MTLNLYNSGSSCCGLLQDCYHCPAMRRTPFNLEDAEYAAFGPFGGAVVTGSAPLAGVAFSLTKGRMTNPSTNYLDTMNTEYRAFTADQLGKDVVAPLVYRNYNQWTTGINVVNNSAASTQVTVTYVNANPAVSGGPWTETKTVGANGMEVFYTPSTAGSARQLLRFGDDPIRHVRISPWWLHRSAIAPPALKAWLTRVRSRLLRPSASACRSVTTALPGRPVSTC